VYEYLEAERIKYAIRLPANRVLQERIGYLLKRLVGRPSNDVRRSYASFTYQAGSWSRPRRVIAKVEWHSGELYPRVGFIVTNMARSAEYVVAFYNKRGTCEQWIKEGKGAINWTRLSRDLKRPPAISASSDVGLQTVMCWHRLDRLVHLCHEFRKPIDGDEHVVDLRVVNPLDRPGLDALQDLADRRERREDPDGGSLWRSTRRAMG
jgi:hypothetical protein